MVCKISTHEMYSLVNRLNARVVTYEKKEAISLERLGDRKIAVVLEGMIYLCMDNEFFERSILRYFTKGDFFTQAMMISTEQNISHLVTKKPAKIAYFHRSELLAYLWEDKRNTRRMFGVIESQLEQEQFYHSFILHQKNIRQKLIMFFQKLSAEQGSDHIKLPMPYSDLSDYLGIERTALMKELSKMKLDGIISGKNHEITLL